MEKSCGAIVFTYEGSVRKYAVIRETYQGAWGFPKGHMENGETEKETALREVKEETGLNVNIRADFRQIDEHSMAREGRPNDKKTNIYFLAEFWGQKPQPQASGVSEILLLDYPGAMARLSNEGLRRILTNAEKYLNEHPFDRHPYLPP